MLAKRLLFTTILFIASGPLSALAEPAGASPPEARMPEKSTPWFAQYSEARAAMVAGDFGAAAAGFAALVYSAPDSPSRFLAAEMESACRTWAKGGFRLTQPGMPRLAAGALLEDRRTTDEISILYTNAVLYGLYAGIVVDTWTKANSAGSAILPPLVLAGVSAGAVALLDRNLHLGYGVAQSIVSGLYVGVEEGVAWSLWHEAHARYSSEWGGKAVTTFIWATGTLGAVAGGVVGTLHGTTPGRASLMGSAAMWAALVGGTLMGGLTGNDDTALLSAAIMLNAGAVAIQDKSATGRGLLTSASLGMAGGLLTSWLLTRDMEIDQPRRQREPSFAERLMPTVAPASKGAGFVLGVGAAI